MARCRKIKFEVQSRHDEVTGSCFYSTIKFPNGEEFKFIVDVGMFQDEQYEFLNTYEDFSFKEIPYIFLTHNHIDHVGGLPMAVKRGFVGKFITSRHTEALLPKSIYDSVKIELANAAQNKTKPLFNAQDAALALDKVISFDFNDSIRIAENVTVTLIENAHLLGASMILFELKYKGEELNILFTGDYNTKNVFFTPAPISKRVKNLKNLIIIQESTYGDINTYEITPTFDDEVPQILDNNKSLLIPSIAQERYATILLHLKNLQKCGKISKKIPIYLDGPLAILYLHYYRNYFEDFMPENIRYVPQNGAREILKDEDQKIIVTTSGMCNNGPAQTYLSNIIEDKRWATYFTCYLADGTVARRIKETNPGASLVAFGKKMHLEMDVYQTSEFSSHAKKDELLEFLKQFKNISAILINHGDEETKNIYYDAVMELGITKNVSIMNRKKYHIISAYGIESIRNTKFVMEPKKTNSTHSHKKKVEKVTKRRSVKARKILAYHY